MKLKLIKIIPFALMCCSLVMAFFSLYGRALELNSRSRLFARINESYLSIVQFYCSDRTSNAYACQKEDYKCIKSGFNAVSQNSRFKQAEIDFILMNCSCDTSIAREFCFSTFPTTMLFVNGVPVPGAILKGFAHECDINVFIESYLADNIDDVIHDKRKERKQKQQAQLAAWAAWSPYWYGGYYRNCGFGYYGGWGRGGCW